MCRVGRKTLLTHSLTPTHVYLARHIPGYATPVGSMNNAAKCSTSKKQTVDIDKHCLSYTDVM